MMSELNRRGFLRGALATGAYLAAARATAFPRGLNLQRHFEPVKVARNRIIREVVGLRPYRPEGFVVNAERVGEKLLVQGPEGLTAGEKILVLSDADVMPWMHRQAWIRSGQSLATWWHNAIRQYAR